MRRWLNAASVAALLCGGEGLIGAQAVSPAIPAGSNTISGQLLDSRDESPIAGAVVTLIGYVGDAGLPTLGIPSSPYSPAYVPRRVMSASDGRFVFRDLPQGRYAISAAAFGYLPNTFPQHWVEVLDGNRPTRAALRLWKSGSISGMVTDESGEPIVGVPIAAVRRQIVGEQLTLDAALEVMTDDRGLFRLAPLRPGSYLVGALSSSSSLPANIATEWDAAAGNRTAAFQLRSQLSRGGLSLEDGSGTHVGGLILQQPGAPPVLSGEGKLLAYPSTFYPDTRRAEAATVVKLGSGDSRDGIDLSLRYLTTVRVSGTVAGPDGVVKHVSVRLLPTGTGVSNETDPPGSYAALTDAAGSFTFVAVPAGEYDLTAVLAVGSSIDGEMFWVSQSVIVGEEDVSGVDVVLERGIIVAGRVEFRSERGGVRPERATVGLRPVGATMWRSMVQGTIAPDGTFTAIVGRLGAHEVYVSIAPSAWAWIGTSIQGKPLADGIAIVTKQGMRDLVVSLSDAPPKLTGTVIDERGAPDASAEVIVFPADTTLWRQGIFHSQRVRSAHVTSAGMFEIPALPPGTYYVVAVPQQHAADGLSTALLERLAAAATTVTLRSGEAGSAALKTLTLRER